MKSSPELISYHQALNRKTWRALEENGLRNDQEVELDFFYYCSDGKGANFLKDFLERETDYQASVRPAPDGREQAWSVRGKTQKTVITPEILDKWVEWMILAGQEFKCDFDGWGTEV